MTIGHTSYLPELGSDLVTALSSLNMNDFTHLELDSCHRLGQKSKKIRTLSLNSGMDSVAGASRSKQVRRSPEKLTIFFEFFFQKKRRRRKKKKKKKKKKRDFFPQQTSQNAFDQSRKCVRSFFEVRNKKRT